MNLNHTDIITILTAAILIANTFHLTKVVALLKDAQAILGVSTSTPPASNAQD